MKYHAMILFFLAAGLSCSEFIEKKSLIKECSSIVAEIVDAADMDKKTKKLLKYWNNPNLAVAVQGEIKKFTDISVKSLPTDFGSRSGEIKIIGTRVLSKTTRILYMIPYEYCEFPMSIVVSEYDQGYKVNGVSFGSACMDDMKAFTSNTEIK